MDLRQQQHQRDEESVDQEREASHPLHAQAMSNGYKVSIVTLLSCLVLNDMSQFQRLASLQNQNQKRFRWTSQWKHKRKR